MSAPSRRQQGRALGAEAFKLAGLKAGDKAIMIGPFENESRGARERGTVAALKEAGIDVVQISSPAGDGRPIPISRSR